MPLARLLALVGPLLALLSVGLAAAQDRAVVEGVVRGDAANPIAGATVTLLPAGVTGRTATDGRFALTAPPVPAASLVTQAVGFKSDTTTLGQLRAGTPRELTITLTRVTVLAEITVTPGRQRPLLDTAGATTGGSVDSLELVRLPTDSRDPLALAYTVPGVAQATGFFDTAAPLTIDGSNSLYTQYNLNGMDNTEAVLGGPWVDVPLSALERLDVSANGYGAELGRSSNGVVDLVTKHGGDAWHGEVFSYGRPGGALDSDRPFATPTPDGVKGLRRIQFGGSAGGPIVRNRTYVFGAAEYTAESEGQSITTGFGGGEGEQVRKFPKLFGSIDQHWNPRQVTTLTAAYSQREFIGRGGGQVVPEADFTQHKHGAIVALTHRSLLGQSTENQLSAQLAFFHWYYPPTETSLTTPQVNIVAADGTTPLATVGASGFQYDHTERQLNLKDVVRRRWGHHTAQAGADLLHGWFTLLGSGTGLAGTYTVIDAGNVITPSGQFVSIQDIPSTIPVGDFTIDAVPQTVSSTQTVVGAFVQDAWQVTPALLLNLGIRWDYDDLTGRGLSSPDLNNVQPRASFNWRPDERTVIRGAGGLYAGKLLYTIWSDALQFSRSGSAVATFSGSTAPAFGQAPSAAAVRAALDTLPPRTIREPFPRGLQSPMSYQASLGFQRELAPSWGISVDAVYEYTKHLPRLWDLNAVQRVLTPGDSINLPCDVTCPGDAFRPVNPRPGSFRQDLTTDTGGKSKYWGVYTTLRHALSRDWSADLTWVWSHAKNDTEDINFAATQGNNFDLEYGDAVNDRRHKVTLRTFYSLRGRVQLAAIADYQSGTPVNRVAFFRDLLGTGGLAGAGFTGNSPRFFGVPRDGERLPGSFELSASASYLLPVARDNVEVRADVFNVLNRTNVSGYQNGVAGGGPRTQIGRPGDPMNYTSAGRPRQAQLSLTYKF